MKASEVYDRQIRLWGVEAQKRMQAARVLFVGLRALPAEVGVEGTTRDTRSHETCALASIHRIIHSLNPFDQPQIVKNVVLAGINVALLDHRPVAPGDLNAQFYLRPENVGTNVRVCLAGNDEGMRCSRMEEQVIY